MGLLLLIWKRVYHPKQQSCCRTIYTSNVREPGLRCVLVKPYQWLGWCKYFGFLNAAWITTAQFIVHPSTVLKLTVCSSVCSSWTFSAFATERLTVNQDAARGDLLFLWWSIYRSLVLLRSQGCPFLIVRCFPPARHRANGVPKFLWPLIWRCHISWSHCEEFCRSGCRSYFE
jgi:hypothetical protein